MIKKQQIFRIDYLYPVAFLILLLGVWEMAVRLLGIAPYLLPAPTAIGRVFVNDYSSLFEHFSVTMGEAVAGFLLANTLGFAVAILFSYSQVAERAIYPYVIALKTTPIIAFAPLLVLWLGTGASSKIMASAVICFFPMVVNATRGLRSVDRDALELFQSLSAGRVQTFFKLRLPMCSPYIFSALRISSALSVVGAIVGEFVGAQRGLGYLILVSSYHLETSTMFAAIVAAAVGGLALFGVIRLTESYLIPWAAPIEE